MRYLLSLLIVGVVFFTSCTEIITEPPYEVSVVVLNGNPTETTSLYEAVSGVAADGVSQLEFAIPYSAENEVVSVEIIELSEQWGVLETQLNAPTEKNKLTAYRFTLTSSESLPTALATSNKAELSYQFEITTADGESETLQSTISVVRPPALFVHGLASEASTYDTMFGFITPKGLFLPEALYAVDYSETTNESYETNKDVVPNGITELRSAMNEVGIVCDRVSVLGHSMGGILTRIYMQGRSSIAYRDDIHKVVTINTPHSGSQLADFGLSLGETSSNEVIKEIVALGAIIDLAVESAATAELNSAANLLIENNLDIPSHLITSHIGTMSDITDLVKDDKIFAALVEVAINKITGDLYNGDSSDIVVPTTSQKGGVSNGLRYNYIEDFDNEWHCSILTSEDVANHVVTILDALTTSSYFTLDGFSPETLTYNE